MVNLPRGEFPCQSSYLYAYNNPVGMIDVDGLYGDENESNRQHALRIPAGFMGRVISEVLSQLTRGCLLCKR
jgi:hypothetical protein